MQGAKVVHGLELSEPVVDGCAHVVEPGEDSLHPCPPLEALANAPHAHELLDSGKVSAELSRTSLADVVEAEEEQGSHGSVGGGQCLVRKLRVQQTNSSVLVLEARVRGLRDVHTTVVHLAVRVVAGKLPWHMAGTVEVVHRVDGRHDNSRLGRAIVDVEGTLHLDAILLLPEVAARQSQNSLHEGFIVSGKLKDMCPVRVGWSVEDDKSWADSLVIVVDQETLLCALV